VTDSTAPDDTDEAEKAVSLSGSSPSDFRVSASSGLSPTDENYV
jgi:hypothetical protein